MSAKKVGWIQTGFADWINTVWSRRPSGLLKNARSFGMGLIQASHERNIKKKLKQMKPDAVIIPGGLTTPMVQPLDVSSNQPFKNSVKKQWTTCGWTVRSIHLHLGVDPVIFHFNFRFTFERIPFDIIFTCF